MERKNVEERRKTTTCPALLALSSSCLQESHTQCVLNNLILALRLLCNQSLADSDVYSHLYQVECMS